MIFSFLIATFVMSDILFVGSTKIGEISDISKCFENFVSQALGFLKRFYAAELRYKLHIRGFVLNGFDFTKLLKINDMCNFLYIIIATF